MTFFGKLQIDRLALKSDNRDAGLRDRSSASAQCVGPRITSDPRQIAIESRFGLAVAYAHRCRKRIAIAAIMPKGTRMKSAIRMPIAMPLARGLRPGGTATSRVSHSSSFMVSSHWGGA